MLIDTHTHLYLDQFDDDRNVVIQNAIEQGVEKLLLPNIDLNSIDGMNALVKEFPNTCYAMMGLHPCSVNADYQSVLASMKTKLDTNKHYIAIGEIGMDLYWDKTFINEQADALKIQIEWAKGYNLPIVIHVRDAFDEIFEVIDPLNDDRLKGIFHCFTGNLNQAHHILNYGNFKLGLGGVLTFKNSGLDKIITDIDLEDLVLETDSPYLAPTPHRGKRNESAYVSLVAQKLADVKEIDVSTVAEITTHNAKSIFGI